MYGKESKVLLISILFEHKSSSLFIVHSSKRAEINST